MNKLSIYYVFLSTNKERERENECFTLSESGDNFTYALSQSSCCYADLLLGVFFSSVCREVLRAFD